MKKTKTIKPQPKALKIAAIIINALLVIAGVLLLFNLDAIVYIISIAILVYGVLLIAHYFGNRKEHSGWDIVSGLVCLLFGGIILFGSHEQMVLGILAIELVIVIWLLASGLLHIIAGAAIKKMGIKGGIFGIVTGVIMLILGIVCLIFPYAFGTAMFTVVAVLTGIVLMIAGIAGLAAVFAVSAAAEQLAEDIVIIDD